ncbi:hypothetical protein BS47DRAFT_1340473 [Hydnum rufescens UP504]|uniref:Aldehyde dehydrogenase domain-containing protein n=1 Tax=Hydnum rufescens UP504 TaxID=1448309 RepID=A0A9P6B4L2_9AGAM|nr:hypothetical protein BS47DRAFT_1340473 [Hydnum rufescens UP504]
MAPTTFSYDFSNEASGFGKKSSFPSGLFINGQFVDSVDSKTIELINPTTAKSLGHITVASEKDIDLAVEAAQKAFETTWGLHASGQERGKLLIRLAELIEENIEELAALESLDNGKAVAVAQAVDVQGAADVLRYYGGWADKVHGKTIETDDATFAYTRHEPIGVVGQITPWNFPIWMLAWKLGPALATGNAVVFKPSEWTPLTALRVASLIKEAGFPPGVVNIVPGIGNIAGAAISNHSGIGKVAFTGSTAVGRAIMKAAASSNLKRVTLELGGKSPTLVLDDCNLENAARWAAYGILANHGQVCCAGTRIYVQDNIYDKFLEKFLAVVKSVKLGDPFHPETFQGPQVSKTQFDRILNYIEHGKKEGATCLLGGQQHGTEGYFIQPTIFTDIKPEMRIVKEEIFGPVGVVAKFSNDEELIKLANDTVYGLAAAVFSENLSRAVKLANALKAGTVWVNTYNTIRTNVPFGGYKQSGQGRELGEYALDNYTQVKAVHINLSGPPPI